MTNTPHATFVSMADLKGRRVILTGGASGIGQATGQLLAERGARVVVLDVDHEAGAELAQAASAAGHDLSFVRADVSNADDAAAAVAQALAILGGVDVLVSAAGIMQGQLTDVADLARTVIGAIVLILLGTLLLAQGVQSTLIQAATGVLIIALVTIYGREATLRDTI